MSGAADRQPAADCPEGSGLAADYAARIEAVALPARVEALAADYADVFGEREPFLWRWIYSLLPEFTLSSVPDAHAATVREQKTILTLFVTLLDDLAEKRGDVRTFEAIRHSVCWGAGPAGARPGVDTEVLALAERLWEAVEAPLEAAPRSDRFREALAYDLRQSLNAMDYARLVNDDLTMATLAGAGHYGPHNMIMFPYADLDLMYSPDFDPAEFGAVRELTWHLQRMARIGNWLSTWERELAEGDYTAGVVVYALRAGIVSREAVTASDPATRAAAAARIRDHGVEERFLAAWGRLYRSARAHGPEAETVDLADYVAGMETVMAHHLASRGHK